MLPCPEHEIPPSPGLFRDARGHWRCDGTECGPSGNCHAMNVSERQSRFDIVHGAAGVPEGNTIAKSAATLAGVIWSAVW